MTKFKIYLLSYAWIHIDVIIRILKASKIEKFVSSIQIIFF